MALFLKRTIACCLFFALLLLGAPASRADTPRMSQEDAVKSALLLEAQTGTVLWQKDADTPYSVAGLGKLPAILTLAQAMDDGSLQADLPVCVSERAAAVLGPTAFLERAETISAADLMKAAVMISAGDAITALGEAAYGSESVFAENINVTLSQLGVSASMPDSLGTGAAFSASALARLGAAAAASGTFTKYASLYLDEIMHTGERRTELVNANRLLNNYAGCGGLLTGSSQQDGYCGVFYAARSGTALIAVVVGAGSAAIRAAAAVELLDYGFANFRYAVLARAGQAFSKDVPVRDGNVRSVDLIVTEEVARVAPAQAGGVSETVHAPDHLEAPFALDEPLGSVDFCGADGALIVSVPLYPSAAAEAFGIKDILKRIMRAFVGLTP